ncbi:MAG: phage tail sheath family protein [Persicimonas sp.]
MASIPNYPGVHLREVPSGTQTIGGASTSVAAFVGYLPKGPVDEPTRVFSFAEFSRHFGGLDSDSDTSYAVQQFFLNGGSEAWIVRVASGAEAAGATLVDANGVKRLELEALTPGSWGDELEVAVYPIEDSEDEVTGFDLVVRQSRPTQTEDGDKKVLAEEVYRGLSLDEDFAARITEESSLVKATEENGDTKTAPVATDDEGDKIDPQGDVDEPKDDDFQPFDNGDDGVVPSADWSDDDMSDFISVIEGDAAASPPTGVYALSSIAPFTYNILSLPDATHLTNTDGRSGQDKAKDLYEKVAKICEDEDAFLLVDPPGDIDTTSDMTDWADKLRKKNAATYFPSLEIADPLDGHKPRKVGPSGTLAGLYARIDSSRGIWKAPAGTEAKLRGAEPAKNIDDGKNGVLNKSGINVLRTFAGYGPVSWGARTLVGNQEGDNKYVPVRRMTLFLKKSLELGLKWAVFEPNGEQLWATIRLTVESFLNRLYRQGAFQGATAKEAYFVLCDTTTTTPDDINRGIVNVVVGFAPLKPAEFVVVQLQQMAGQAQS